LQKKFFTNEMGWLSGLSKVANIVSGVAPLVGGIASMIPGGSAVAKIANTVGNVADGVSNIAQNPSSVLSAPQAGNLPQFAQTALNKVQPIAQAVANYGQTPPGTTPPQPQQPIM
jgi:uncharacterized membrane protein